MSKLPGRMVLIVDDHDNYSAELRQFLRAEGMAEYTVIKRRRGEMGLAAARSRQPDAVLLAAQLPDLSARQWLDALKAETPLSVPPVVVLLNEDDAELARETMISGAQLCLTRQQVKPETLGQMVRSLIQLAESQRLTERQHRELARRHHELAEAVLRHEQLNQAVLDSLPEHIAVLNQQGVIVAVNRAWRSFARANGAAAPASSGVGVNYLQICEQASGEFADEAQEVCAKIKAVLEHKLDRFIIEYPCHSPTEARWFLMHVTPLTHEGGGAVVAHLNITERRKIEAERTKLLAEAQRAHETAEAANRAKDEFIAQISHDLRAPLNAILGWAKVLRGKQLDEATREEALETIHKSAEKQRHLIEDLLDVSRIISGKLKLDVRPLSLSEVIRSAMEVMMPACEAKEIDCITELATEADAITGDPARLEQVIWNLVSNAVKFTPQGGRVVVRLERADPYLRITVNDTGKGIRPEHLPYIFDRYWQPGESGKRRSGGLGLGLSLVRHIVELHGGTVEAESEGEGKGTRFIINLPYRAVRVQNGEQQRPVLSSREQETKPASPFQTAVLPSSALAGLLILVVDDEQDACELVSAILRQHGAEVTTAGSVAEAVGLLSQAGPLPDLLISDVSLPGEDGYSLIRRLRRLPPNQGGQIPAIAVTAYGRMEDRIRALSAGFQMHLPKPVEPVELALIAANLTRRSLGEKPL